MSFSWQFGLNKKKNQCCCFRVTYLLNITQIYVCFLKGTHRRSQANTADLMTLEHVSVSRLCTLIILWLICAEKIFAVQTPTICFCFFGCFKSWHHRASSSSLSGMLQNISNVTAGRGNRTSRMTHICWSPLASVSLGGLTLTFQVFLTWGLTILFSVHPPHPQSYHGWISAGG